LALHAFLLANSKKALQAVINAAESSTSENIEASLMLQVEANSILSASINQASDVTPAVEAPQAQDAGSQAQAKGKGARSKANSKKVQAETAQAEIAQAETAQAETVQTDNGWSGIAPLRKLHNIAVLLKTSNLLYRSWICAIGVALGIDNVTRWNSWFNVIDAALRHRPAIAIWLMENTQHLEGNNLDKNDWDLLQKTHEFLQPFKQGTLLTEKNLSTLSDAMMVLDILLIHCRKTRVSKANNLFSLDIADEYVEQAC
jgi:hypothetical protein